MIPLSSQGDYQSFDLQESERLYQMLLQENRLLREKHQYSMPTQPYLAHLPVFNHHEPFHSPQELNFKVRQGNVVGPDVRPTNDEARLIQKVCPHLSDEGSNIAEMSLAHRNKYLQGKIFMLRKEVQSQSKKTSKMDRKVNHQTTCPDCYESRYYALLRLTSPN